jgi:hypothetical protein
MGCDEHAGMDLGERHRTIFRLGDLHRAAERDGDQPIGVAVDWTTGVRRQPGRDVHDSAAATGWRVVLLHGLAHGTVDVDGGRQPGDNRDGRRGLFLDILEYRDLGRGDQQRRFRIRNRGIHGCREYDPVRTLSCAEHCRTNHHRHAGGKHLQLHAEPGEPLDRCRRRHRDDHGQHRQRLPMGRDDVAGMDFVERHRTIFRLGDLHRAAEHDGEQSIGAAVDWTADVHHQPGRDVLVDSDGAGSAGRVANRGWWAVIAARARYMGSR